MNFIEPAIFILLFAILSVPIATRFHLPLEIFLVIGSCILSLSPWLPPFQLNPQIVFNLFLPPILFYAAYFTSWRDFKFNFRPISLLAFGLVIFTMFVVAIMSKLLLTEFTWAECFLLGAIVSPTDATSATSIIKKLGAPHRLIAILEGESMINDATALILFRFSLAVILGGSVSLPQAAAHFVFVATGGIIIGLLVGVISIYLIPKIHSVTAETTFTFITAFTCYFLSESIEVSGIIATVVGGIYCGIYFPEIASSLTRINAKASWNTLLFIINGFVFTLIGLELPLILKNLQVDVLETLIFHGLMISIIVILARLIWVYPMAYYRLFLLPLRKISHLKILLYWVGGMRGIVSCCYYQFIVGFSSIFPHRFNYFYIVCYRGYINCSRYIPTYYFKIFHLPDEK